MKSHNFCFVLIFVLCSVTIGNGHGHAHPHMGRTHIRPAHSHHSSSFRSEFHNQPHAHGSTYIRPAGSGSGYNNYRHGLFDKISSWMGGGRSESIPHRHTTHHHRYNPMKANEVHAHLSVGFPIHNQPRPTFWRMQNFLSSYPSYDSLRSGFTLTLDLFKSNVRLTNILVLIVLNAVFIQYDYESQEIHYNNLILYNVALIYLILFV